MNEIALKSIVPILFVQDVSASAAFFLKEEECGSLFFLINLHMLSHWPHEEGATTKAVPLVGHLLQVSPAGALTG